jgi:type IV pilus assembly protein PilY1
MVMALCVAVASADDTEIFFGGNNGGNANVLFILDTSGSMNDVVTSAQPYDSTNTNYAANTCSANFSSAYVYYGKGGKIPACASTATIPVASFKCVDAKTALATGAGTAASGYYAGSTIIQWGPLKAGSGTNQWNPKLGVAGATDVECQNDAGVAGNGVLGGANLYPSKNSSTTSSTGVWDVVANSWWAVKGNAGGSYTVYSANYLNYYYDSRYVSTNTKVAVLQQGMASILGSVSNINIGLMRYDANGTGGMVTNAIAPLATNSGPVLATVNSDAPTGSTPISEVLYEAYLYFSGGKVNYGNKSQTSTCTQWVVSSSGMKTCASFTTSNFPSVPASRNPATANGANYASPANLSCQKNFIVFLTDGLPNGDAGSDKAIQALPNYKTGAQCYANSSAMYTALGVTQPSGTDGSGLCSAAMANYMYKNDMRPDVAAVQNVTTYFIGFGNDFSNTQGAPTAAFNYLQDIAAKGGGQAFTATNLSDLTSAFTEILATVVKTNTLFSAPAVAVNAFNRTQTLNDLYVSVFSPKSTYHWPGNMKHYKVVNGQVVDANGVPAVDPSTGFFTATAQSIWSTAPDGFDVKLGGAANNIPAPTARNVYTYIGTNPLGAGAKVPLTGSANTTLSTSNTLLTATLLGIGGPTDPTLANLVNWARGQDILDENGNGNTTEARLDMGDPIHTAPAVLVYGKNANGTDHTVAYASTNDGYLHAIDASTGVELWSYVPQEMLLHLKDLYNDGPAPAKHYGLDGPITVLKYDVNNDGTVDATAGDRVILFFGTGRNTDVSKYYALDVTDPVNPVLLWVIDGGTLPGLGQAWSQPVLTRVNVSGATQNAQKLALVIGGGYDPSEDGYSYSAVAASTPEQGSHVYMVDALYGNLLWAAGSLPGTGISLVNASMDHAIPSTLAVLDLNGDGYADRLYVGDMAGQVWRFDVTNGNPASSLVAGGVIASLGARDVAAHPATAARRFYNAPDIASVQQPGVAPYISVAIGSGYRGHPLDKVIQDRFYEIRDMASPFANLPQASFNSSAIVPLIRDAEIVGTTSLVDITTQVAPVLPSGAYGWQLDLNQYGGWVGEKVLSSASTFNNAIIFTTYSPTPTASTDPCAGVGAGTNRVYYVSVQDGGPMLDRNKDGAITTADRATDLAQGGIAPQTAFLFLQPGAASGAAAGAPALGGSTVTCLTGVEVLGICSNFNQRVKTYWREAGAQ